MPRPVFYRWRCPIETPRPFSDLEHRIARYRLVALAGLAVAVASLATAAAALVLVRERCPDRIAALTVERLDVVEPDGQLVMSLGNSRRLPQPLIAGRTVETGRSGPGIIFFDGKGWEVGGLIYRTSASDSGAHLSFDQYRNDQVVVLEYTDDGAQKSAGLHVHDRARKPDMVELLALAKRLERATPAERATAEKELEHIAAERVFIGSTDETATVSLADRAGNDRIRMVVDPAGAAHIDFLDAAGTVVERLPHEGSAAAPPPAAP